MRETVVSPGTAEAAAPVLYGLVRARAAADAERSALVDLTGGGPRDLSYAQLVHRTDTLAHRLAARVGPDEPVAVLLDRSADTVVAMLAVLAAGGVYCPIDVTSPDARIAGHIGLLGARVALADSTNAARLPAGVTVIPPDGTAPVPVGDVAPSIPDGLAYVLQTSGSTGVPKAVAMTRRGLDRLIRWQIADGEPDLRTLQFTATSFDVTFQEILSTFVTGGCLVVPPEEIRRDPAALLDTIVREGIQRLFLPYVALQLLAVEAGRRAVVPASLRHVITAGERLVITPAIRDMFAAMPGCRLDNHYGPTEAHLVTSFTMPADPALWRAVPPIGRPVDGVACRVLDDRLAPTPAGELYVGGDGLARGYLHDAGRTAERFVADPEGPPGARLYRTGDLVRAAAGGVYEFVGRADAQLKVRGFRVEPAEVEHALLRHPRVETASVGLREVTDGVPVLVAYLQTNGAVRHREITEHARGLLPAYMIPSRFLTVAAMPRTSTGKIDARALAGLELPEVPDTAPAASSLTETITAIWTRVLGHDEFDNDDDFFDVGGDSLLATWVVNELGQVLGRPVELSVFLEFSTVEDLSTALGTAPPAGQPARSSQIVTLRPGPSNRSLYLLHPLGGELICYRELARTSRAPLRLLGVGWTGAPPAYGSSLSEIAATHVAQLRTIQPDGPYLLAGWSFGGVLAYEIAQQLRSGGAAVDFLGLLDANPVLDPLTGLPMARTPFLCMLDDVVARLDDPAVTGAELAALTSGPTWIQLMGAPITPGASSGYLRRALDTARACMSAAMRYEPRTYAGPLHLFQAAGGGAERQAELAAAIRALCPDRSEVTSIAGDHWGLIRSEHVAETAAELDGALERAGAGGNSHHGS